MVNKSLRHYEWFYCDITMTLRLCGCTREIRSSVQFISAFSLRQLRACITPYRFFPKVNLTVDLEFGLLGEVVTLPDDRYHPFLLQNYQSIEVWIVQEIIYCLIYELLLNSKN